MIFLQFYIFNHSPLRSFHKLIISNINYYDDIQGRSDGGGYWYLYPQNQPK